MVATAKGDCIDQPIAQLEAKRASAANPAVMQATGERHKSPFDIGV
jgi:hypothetical protein